MDAVLFCFRAFPPIAPSARAMNGAPEGVGAHDGIQNFFWLSVFFLGLNK
jgi:hypothetical protein